jgi:broad specificity phosphatase PhoE
MKRFFLSLLLIGLFASAAAAQPTIFIVRHAEKAMSMDRDPDLSEVGRLRALSLAKTLRDAGITAIYVTDLKRTQQTAAPLAKALGIKPAILPPNDVAALSSKLRDIRAGNVLVVGHSDTVPKLINALGITASISLNDTDYDNLFVVLLEEKPRLIRLHYR